MIAGLPPADWGAAGGDAARPVGSYRFTRRLEPQDGSGTPGRHSEAILERRTLTNPGVRSKKTDPQVPHPSAQILPRPPATRTRGDECCFVNSGMIEALLPRGAGMDRHLGFDHTILALLPRARGDANADRDSPRVRTPPTRSTRGCSYAIPAQNAANLVKMGKFCER